MRKILICVLFLSLIVCCKNSDSGSDAAAESEINVLTDEEINEGWQLLFDGSTTNGWRGINANEFPDRQPGDSGAGLGNHYQNFVDAIRANDMSVLNGDIEEGFYSCALIHLGNIAYRLGRTLEFDPETMKFKHDEEANVMLTREYREPFVVSEKV